MMTDSSKRADQRYCHAHQKQLGMHALNGGISENSSKKSTT